MRISDWSSDVCSSDLTIREEGVTVFLVEQNANKALQVADRGYVLETGQVVLADTGANLLVNDEVRKAYLGAQSIFGSGASVLAGSGGAIFSGDSRSVCDALYRVPGRGSRPCSPCPVRRAVMLECLFRPSG